MMVRFKDFIVEGKYPNWVRISVGVFVLKIKSLSDKIESEKDPVEQNKLISKQNQLLSYISGLSVGVSTNDKLLVQKLKSQKG